MFAPDHYFTSIFSGSILPALPGEKLSGQNVHSANQGLGSVMQYLSIAEGVKAILQPAEFCFPVGSGVQHF